MCYGHVKLRPVDQINKVSSILLLKVKCLIVLSTILYFRINQQV